MISFPLYLFLIPYLIILGAFAILFLLSFSHLLHFKAFSFTSFLVTALAIVAIIINLFLTFGSLSTVNWTESFTIGENIQTQNLLN